MEILSLSLGKSGVQVNNCAPAVKAVKAMPQSSVKILIIASSFSTSKSVRTRDLHHLV
jgi:hypothetical protein